MKLQTIKIAGKEILPIIEGGKGVAVSTGITSGNFALNNCAGTFSGVYPDSYDKNGNVIPQIFKGKTRDERQQEIVDFAVKGSIDQAKQAYETSNGNGVIFINMLWGLSSVETIIHRIFEKTQGLIHGISCGAGMPFNLSNIAAKYKMYYNPIVSSLRALKILWKRSYSKTKEWIGAVIFEDPWLAGGHTGLTNKEDPNQPEDPYKKILEIRNFLNEIGMNDTPIIIAGGIWYLKDWEEYIDNKELGKIAFQFGTRPMVTKESPISSELKNMLLNLEKNKVELQKLSPTGLYSSAVKNKFLNTLIERNKKQIDFNETLDNDFNEEITINEKKYYIKSVDKNKYNEFINKGYNKIVKTPDNTLLFLNIEDFNKNKEEQANCSGCLSFCKFSGWAENKDLRTTPDHRSFCIYKTLYNLMHGGTSDNDLVFAGSNAYKFKTDPFYQNGKFIPTIKELIERIKTGF